MQSKRCALGSVAAMALVGITGCSSQSTESGPSMPVDETVAIPDVDFELDTEFECKVSETEPAVLERLVATYGVEMVASKSELAEPSDKIKFWALPDDPMDGYIQVPIAVWDEAEMLLPTLQALWQNESGDARGQEHMRRIVRAADTPFPFEHKTILLFVCPNAGAAYGMTGYPIYNYLETVYPDDAERWTQRDFVDWYMLHEIIHWYLLYQPWLRVWTPALEKHHAALLADDPNLQDPPLIFPASGEYPDLYVNEVDSLGHLHLNAIRYEALREEPETWQWVMEREKRVTDKYYAWAIDVIDTMSDADRRAVLQEVTGNPSPCAPGAEGPKPDNCPAE